MNQSKPCIRCNKDTPIHEFYVHKKMADGRLNVCKSCVRARVQNHRIEKMKDPQWAKEEAKRQREKTIRRRITFPEKTEAHAAVSHSRAKNGNHLHHWSYWPEHFTDVFELESSDHWQIHTKMQYDQERRMYRTIPDLELLDSREKAKAFYESILEKELS